MKFSKMSFLFMLLIGVNHFAQAQTFYEATESFFNTNKTYSMKSLIIKGLGDSGMTNYKKGEATITINSKSITIKYGDGSKSTHKIVGGLKNCKVYTNNGDVTMQMYILDDETAIRAIRWEDGRFDLHSYVFNRSMSKYIHTTVYMLY